MVQAYWCRFGVSSFLGVVSLGVGITTGMSAAGAQLIPDASLGADSSVVTPNAVINGSGATRIDGGAQRGANLFHSFQEFSVNAGQRVYFANPLGIDTILSRVTGGSLSTIDGLLGVDGAADLFLLNPHGVLFGANAQLDLDGSFFVSTANSLPLADGHEFSAIPSPGGDLLSVSMPLGVQTWTAPQGNIAVRGSLALAPEQTLTLFGDTVTSSGSLQVPGGTVQVLGNQVNLQNNASINVSGLTDGGTVLVGGDYQGQGTIPTAGRTTVAPGATIRADAGEWGQGGQIIIWADEAADIQGSLTARGGTLGGDGGLIETSAKDTLHVTARVDASAPSGSGGLWLIDPTNITIVPMGVTGIDISIVGADQINLALNNGTSVTITTNIGGSEAGDITQEPGAVIEKTDGGAATLTLEADRNILIQADILSMAGPLPVILLGDRDGDGDGNVSIAPFPSGSVSILSNGGDISITGNANNIEFGNGVDLFLASIESDGGDIFITGNATMDAINGVSLTSSTIESGDGKISIRGNANTGSGNGVTISSTSIESSGGTISITGSNSNSTFGSGNGVRLFASPIDSDGENIEIVGNSVNGIGVFIAMEDITSSGGTISITGMGDFNGISTSSGPTIDADQGKVLLTGNNISFGEDTTVEGETVKIDAGDRLDLFFNSLVFATDLIQIEADRLRALDFDSFTSTVFVSDTVNADIISDNQLSLNVAQIEGFIFQEGLSFDELRNNSTNDISPPGATADNTGDDVEADDGYPDLPAEPASENLTLSSAIGCNTDDRFIVSGRGGLPPGPTDPQAADPVEIPWVAVDEELPAVTTEALPSITRSDTRTEQLPRLVEAQGWITDADGQIYFVADASSITPRSLTAAVPCNAWLP
ncbi:hypothetical protein XM38_050320 [Halomicronema hongdechloris C2206]|uniref:Filamentous haemagglutinin FhaB/tRNA nuclease CdiA-like TPS domain-containing protein n=1 Tax=Halomicronema hongdechloris C2206 TaxID=1641165 RepID=A0A1Z3HUR0_9CYAN|nr:filamentous hemagglutinin N-terminal domain-containing protein [Halomicronema hongdechloris]ASC74058.1 hypothetical protein XM38_050320 [Halomicronema hongdechloris C2206]